MKKFLIVVSFAVLYFGGCTTEPGADQPKVDSKILITLTEDFSSGTRKVNLQCKTDINYPCVNYLIANQVQINGNTIAINITHIAQPEECSDGSGPALATIPLGSLANGTYQLQILTNGSVLQSNITVTSSSITADKNEDIRVTIVNPVLKKIPENTIWGYIGYSDDSSAIRQVQPFLDTLAVLGADEYEFSPGSYGYFDVDSSGAITSNIELDTDNEMGFAFRYTSSNTNQLRNLIKYYGEHSALSVGLFNTKGDAFYTWELAGGD